jgi:hypothetical protein
MDAVSSSAPAETTPQETNEEIQPVVEQPPEQEYQTANPEQLYQDRNDENPPTHGVSSEEANAAREESKKQDDINADTSIKELIGKAFFIADGIGDPEVRYESARTVSLYFPSDDSMVIIRIEARPGRWGGVSTFQLGDKGKEAANKAFDKQKEQFEKKKAELSELAQQEARSDAHAREEGKPLDPPKETPQPDQPAQWEGARQ